MMRRWVGSKRTPLFPKILVPLMLLCGVEHQEGMLASALEKHNIPGRSLSALVAAKVCS